MSCLSLKPDMKRVHPSGYQKRAETAKKIAASVDNVPKIHSFFSPSTSTVTTDETLETPYHSVNVEDVVVLDDTSHTTSASAEDISVPQTIIQTEITECISSAIPCIQAEFEHDDFYDLAYPSDRGHFEDTITDLGLKKKIVLYGPCQPNITFTSNEDGRKFSID